MHSHQHDMSLSQTLKRNWLFIGAGAIVGAAIALVYINTEPVRYQSESSFVIAPDSLASSVLPDLPGGLAGSALSLLGGNQGTDRAELYLTQLRSRDFLNDFLKSQPRIAETYKPLLSQKQYRVLAAKHRNNQLPPELLDNFRENYFRILPTASEQIFRLSVTSTSPGDAARLNSDFLTTANRRLRERALLESRNRLTFLREQLAHTSNNLLVAAISQLAAEELRRMTLITGSPSFGLQVIDQPTLSERPTWPKPTILIGLGLVSGAAVALLLIHARRMFR